MPEVSWGKRTPVAIAEIQTAKPNGLRYWAARFLILIAARIINSNVVTRYTAPPLEAEK